MPQLTDLFFWYFPPVSVLSGLSWVALLQHMAIAEVTHSAALGWEHLGWDGNIQDSLPGVLRALVGWLEGWDLFSR